MTLADYATEICMEVNQHDADSIAAAKVFVNRRYRMIWNSHAWRDALGLVAVTADNTGLMPLPPAIERPISIRASGDHELVPTDSAYVMQIEPAAFEEIGTPLAFEEFTDTTNNNARMIRFFPVPSQNTAMLVFGKRALVPLVADTDAPVLRNIENVIIAYVHVDMLNRQRQYAKAQLILQEASAMLDAMRRLETEQSATVQRIVPEQIEPDWHGYDDWTWLKGETAASTPVLPPPPPPGGAAP